MAPTEKITRFLEEPRNVAVAGIRPDGRPHVTPNWFVFDGEHFYVSTTRGRAKYRNFTRDPRVELMIDDSTGFRCVLVSGEVEIREDLEADLEHFRAIREKHGVAIPPAAELLAGLKKENRVLLVVTPSSPMSAWRAWGLD